jgi:hypothetical protein
MKTIKVISELEKFLEGSLVKFDSEQSEKECSDNEHDLDEYSDGEFDCD